MARWRWLLRRTSFMFPVILFLRRIHLSAAGSLPPWTELRGAAGPAIKNDDAVGIAGCRDEYDDSGIDDGVEIPLRSREGHSGAAPEAWCTFSFGRFRSPDAVKAMIGAACRRHHRRRRPLRHYRGRRDGRTGLVASTRLGGDWVLAESEQVAESCTSEEVLAAYLDGGLQKVWNADKVLDTKFSLLKRRDDGDNSGGEVYYRQDLVLRSQRVIREHTGVMRYSQVLSIDKIGTGGRYCVSVRMAGPEDYDAAVATATVRKPLDSLNVYIGLQQQGPDVRIYAAGIMEVNRKVVPNLIVFDASGIAGSMAGKGTLWLAAYFEKEREKKKPVLAATTSIASSSLLLQRKSKHTRRIGFGFRSFLS